jgi:glycosyltransferase involved in cell wall biosynthesis
MRIVLVNDDYPLNGSGSSVAMIAANLARHYRALGHDVTTITSHRTQTSKEIIRSPGVISLPVSYRLSLRHYHCLYSPRVSAMLEKEIAALKPDVVHAHNIHTYLTYDALRIARKHASKVFITLHDVMSFSYWRLTAKNYLANHDARLTVADHWRHAGLQFNPLRNRWIRHAFSAYADRVFAVSRALEHALKQNHIENTRVVHNGIDMNQWRQPAPDETAAFASRHGTGGRRVILFGGRLSMDKGSTPILKAIDALRDEFPDILLLVAGDTKDWNAMQAASGIDEKKLAPHCRLAGWLNADEMRLAYDASSIVTTPSLCLDCFPSTNLEAMASGKPVVGTIFGGTPEAVEHGVTGYVCDPRTPDYEGYLRKLLQDDDMRARMGEAGKKRVKEQFSLDLQAQAYLREYGDVQ